MCRTVHVRSEADAASRIAADQSGDLLHAFLRRRLCAVSAIPLHHVADGSDSLRLSRPNLRPNLPRHLHARRSRTHVVCSSSSSSSSNASSERRSKRPRCSAHNTSFGVTAAMKHM